MHTGWILPKLNKVKFTRYIKEFLDYTFTLGSSRCVDGWVISCIVRANELAKLIYTYACENDNPLLAYYKYPHFF